MEEIITIDGRPLRIIYDRPLTAEQKAQAIIEIRKSGAANLGIKGLQEPQGPPPGTYEQSLSGCIGLNILQPGPLITIESITIDGVAPDISTCGCFPSPCTPDAYCNVMILCPDGMCTVTIVWANTGDAPGTFIPQITIDDGLPIMGDPEVVIVPEQINTTPGTAIQTFSLPLSQGQHIVCIDTGEIT